MFTTLSNWNITESKKHVSAISIFPTIFHLTDQNCVTQNPPGFLKLFCSYSTIGREFGNLGCVKTQDLKATTLPLHHKMISFIEVSNLLLRGSKVFKRIQGLTLGLELQFVFLGLIFVGRHNCRHFYSIVTMHKIACLEIFEIENNWKCWMTH